MSAAADKAERNYYDQLYLDKQAEARRKLAYDYNMVGSVNKTRKVPGGARNWNQTKSLGKQRTMKFLNSSFDGSNSSKARGPNYQTGLIGQNSKRGLSYF